MRTDTRAAGIVIKNPYILLIERKTDEEHYFVFPGGGVEEGETPEQAAVRELEEETSILVDLDRLVFKLTYFEQRPERNTQLFYLCKYVSGEPSLHSASEELAYMNAGNGVYIPQWVPLDRIQSLTLYPFYIRDRLLDDIENGFVGAPFEVKVNVNE
jgi:8-oxo-dGTP diphosphatase